MRLKRRFEAAVDEGQLMELVEDAAARIEALMDEIRSRACGPEADDWIRRCGRHSRTEWVA